MGRITKFYFTYRSRTGINVLPMESHVETSAGHDACGVGFIAHVGGRSGRDIVSLGLAAVRRLPPRGAAGALGAVDGWGVLTAIPWQLLETRFAGGAPAGRTRALGMLFVHAADRQR